MDGTRTSRKTTLRACAAASLVLAALALALAPAAPALAADPATDLAAEAAPVQAAQQVARDYWQTNPCGGQIALVWMDLLQSTNASSTWANPVGQYDAPDQNTSCQITFNQSLPWDWTRFCSILVHEYGHLAGHAHADDPADVMFAYYEAPVAQCVAAAPAQPAAVAQPAAAAVTQPVADATTDTASTAKPRAITSSHRAVRRGGLVLVRETNRGRGRAHRAQRHHHRRHRAQGRHHRKHRALRGSFRSVAVSVR